MSIVLGAVCRIGSRGDARWRGGKSRFIAEDAMAKRSSLRELFEAQGKPAPSFMRWISFRASRFLHGVLVMGREIPQFTFTSFCRCLEAPWGDEACYSLL